MAKKKKKGAQLQKKKKRQNPFPGAYSEHAFEQTLGDHGG